MICSPMLSEEETKSKGVELKDVSKSERRGAFQVLSRESATGCKLRYDVFARV